MQPDQQNGHAPQDGAKARGTLRRHATALAALLALLALCVAVAQADAPQDQLTTVGQALGDPGPYSCSNANPAASTTGCADTELTPVAKDGAARSWHQVEGAAFPDSPGQKVTLADPDPAAAVPATTDFFAVAFLDAGDGYAAGSDCQDPPPTPVTDMKASELDDYARACTRVPVIWRYTQPKPDVPGTWTREYRGTSPGYVGGIAFTTDGLVVAVGGSGLSENDSKLLGDQIYTPEHGTGAYPYREDCGTPTLQCPAGWDDEAGGPRVWEKPDPSATGGWCEAAHGCAAPLDSLPSITHSDGTPATPMSGFTALDCSPRSEDNGWCIAGGYQQLWMWRNGQFEHGVDRKNGNTEIGSGALAFRVRSVRFTEVPHITNISGQLRPVWDFVVGTAGCCGPVADAVDVPPRSLLGPASTRGRVIAHDRQSGWILVDDGHGLALPGRDAAYSVFPGLPAGTGTNRAYVVWAPGSPRPAPGMAASDPSSTPPDAADVWGQAEGGV